MATQVPDAARLQRFTEAWLDLLREAAVQALKEVGAPGGQKRAGEVPQGDGLPKPRPPWAPAAPPDEHPLSQPVPEDSVHQLLRGVNGSLPTGAGGFLDKAAVTHSRFRVRVPEKYPGVQYRKSMNLHDRYQRYAENDTVVSGVVEGEWLRLNDKVFLPMEVNGIKILEALRDEGGTAKAEACPAGNRACWFSCGAFTAAEDKEILTHIDEPS